MSHLYLLIKLMRKRAFQSKRGPGGEREIEVGYAG